MSGWELIGNQVVQGQHNHHQLRYMDVTTTENITDPEKYFIVGMMETGAIAQGACCLVKFNMETISIVLRP